MDISQQLFLFLLGMATGLVVGIVFTVLFQRSREAAQNKSPEVEKTEVQYGAVTPDQIHTLPNEAEDENALNKVCPVCGHENPPDNLFCYDCGGRLH